MTNTDSAIRRRLESMVMMEMAAPLGSGPMLALGGEHRQFASSLPPWQRPPAATSDRERAFPTTTVAGGEATARNAREQRAPIDHGDPGNATGPRSLITQKVGVFSLMV
jgi:hypothetical protein